MSFVRTVSVTGVRDDCGGVFEASGLDEMLLEF